MQIKTCLLFQTCITAKLHFQLSLVIILNSVYIKVIINNNLVLKDKTGVHGSKYDILTVLPSRSFLRLQHILVMEEMIW